MAGEKMKQELLIQIDRLHTTKMGAERISRNLEINITDVIQFCKEKILNTDSSIIRKGKNWYIENGDCVITVNAHSDTIITAHKKKK